MSDGANRTPICRNCNAGRESHCDRHRPPCCRCPYPERPDSEDRVYRSWEPGTDVLGRTEWILGAQNHIVLFAEEFVRVERP